MISSDIPRAEVTHKSFRVDAAAPAPALGDVIDSIDDAAATFGRIIRNEAHSLTDDVRGMIREQPVMAVAVVGAVAYLLGRLMR